MGEGTKSIMIAGPLEEKRPFADHRFRRDERLRHKSDFERVHKLRRRVSDRLLTVFVAENGLPWSRLGVSVSRRVGNAVTRNLIRRRIREAFRTSKELFPPGVDLVCVVKPHQPASLTEYRQSLVGLIPRALSQLPLGGKP